MPNVVEILVKGRDKFSGPAKSAQTSAGGLKGAMGGLGKTVMGVGAGFIAAQASIAGVQKIMSASIGAAMKFEHQMAQIRGLTGATREDTDLLEGSIKDMARAMPKSPAELGAGAYFIISAGITDAAEAANVLEISAKASAAGLGETKVVADAVTSALNAYKLGAGEAERMTDVLTTTVRLGKTEASALAGSIGRILPVAAAMGVSFEEVGANLAVMTKVGLSADEAATSLRATMTSLLKPTSEAEDALAAMGISSEALRQQIREKGLLSTLSTLMEKTGGNTAEITKIIPNVRALTNVLGTVGSQAETYADTLDQMNRAQGATETAFGEVADTAQFKVGVAMNELNVTLMELGQVALPLLANGAGVASDAVTILSTTVRVAKGDLDALDDSAKDAGVDLLKLGTDIGTVVSQQVRDIVGPVNLARDAFGAAFGKGGTAQRALFDTGEMADRMAERHSAAAEEIERASVSAVISLADIRDMADEARTGLTNMFRETTAEEASAELALANLKLEAGRLEAKTGDLTAAEQVRLDLLNDELIPAQQGNLDLLRLEKDAVEKHALAQDTALSPMEAWRKKVEGQTLAVDAYDRKVRSIPAEVGTTISLGFRDFTAAQVAQMIGPGFAASLFPAQHGYHGDVTRPTLFLAGEAGQKERVDITPGGGGGRGRTIENHFHFDGPILGDERQAMQFARMILPEIRRQVAA